MDAFIDDGYTEVVGIEAVDGLHPAMEFTRRPFVGDEVQEEFRKVQLGPTALHRDPKKRKPEKIRKEQSQDGIRSRLFELLLSRTSDWSFPESSGEAPPMTAENLRRMNGKLFEKFHNIVLGYDLPDYVLDEEGNRKESDPEGDAGNSTPASSS